MRLYRIFYGEFGSGFEPKFHFFLDLFLEIYADHFWFHAQMLEIAWVKQIKLQLTLLPPHDRRLLMLFNLPQILPMNHQRHPMIYQRQKEHENRLTPRLLEIINLIVHIQHVLNRTVYQTILVLNGSIMYGNAFLILLQGPEFWIYFL